MRRVEAFDSLVGSGTALTLSLSVLLFVVTTLYTSLESQAEFKGLLKSINFGCLICIYWFSIQGYKSETDPACMVKPKCVSACKSAQIFWLTNMLLEM